MKKLAIVTGAASGFGREFARILAKDSYNLLLVDIDEHGLQETKSEIRNSFGVEADLLVCDLALPQSADKIYSEVKHLTTEVLINNAGYGLFGYFSSTDWQIEERMLQLHVLTLTRLTKLFLPGMIARGTGRIMNVSSVAAFQPGPLMAVYYASKAYILYFTEALANELKGTGVTATVFCPGQTETKFQETVARYSKSKLSDTRRLTAKLSPVARIGYNAMMSGKPLSVPGGLNKLIMQLNRIMPRETTIQIVRRLQEKIRN